MQLTWTKSTMSVYKLFSVSCSMDICSKSSSPLVNILVKIDCSRPHRTSMSRHFNLSRRLCVFGERGRGRRLCVFGGLCVDLWRLVHRLSFLLFWLSFDCFWLFLTIGTLLVPTVKRHSKQQKWPSVYQSSHVYTESAEYTKCASASAEYTKPFTLWICLW